MGGSGTAGRDLDFGEPFKPDQKKFSRQETFLGGRIVMVF